MCTRFESYKWFVRNAKHESDATGCYTKWKTANRVLLFFDYLLKGVGFLKYLENSGDSIPNLGKDIEK